MSKQQHALSTGPTLADQAYGALRDEIISGRLEPGERLTERHLAERLGVSPTPIREALQRLEHEHLIERTDTRRIQVAKPSVRRIYELALVEAALRGVAARLAAENATDAELEAIGKAHAQFTELVMSSPEKALKTTRRMHELIDQASHNDALVRMIATATAFDWQFRLETVEEIYGPNP
jgi:DNA-binding GntR family transcriptional regulator